MKRKTRKQTKGKRFWGIFLSVAAAILLLGSLAVGGVGIYIERNFDTTAPPELFLSAEQHRPPCFYVYRFSDRANRIGVAEELASANVASDVPYVRYTELPPELIHAFIAIEDKRFYRHRGVDWYRTAAAVGNYILGNSNRFGASTITQQTVKNLTGNSEITWQRKLQEILYAVDLERHLEKSEIMELYLNVISFSDGCIGVGEAAAHYFSKSCAELTPAECATIAAITNNPSYYNPIRHPENNLTRRNLILREMWAQGYLEEREYLEAVQMPTVLAVSGEERDRIQSWYVDMVIEDVIHDLCQEYGMSRTAASIWVHGKGLRIEVAMDPRIQELVEDYYRIEIKTPTNDKGEHAQSALIVIDGKTGDILGVAGAVGEKNANRIQNYATQALRPPGSAIKPLSVYAPALEKGLIHWGSVYDDVPVNFGPSGNAPWPKNATGAYRGLCNISYAVAHSTNTVAVRVLQELGLRESYRFAKERFHLESMVDGQGVTDCDIAALALGQLNYGLTLRELTCAYTAFCDGGSYHAYRSYYRVTDANGEILLVKPDSAEVVLSRGNAAVMTQLLRGVVKYGTSSSITLSRSMECAGKTGTTQKDYDRWFIGYTPELICGVWCGYEYPETVKGSNLCTGVWDQVMKRITQGNRYQSKFEIPPDVIQLSYCRDSGELCDDACLFDPRGERSEVGWFVKDHVPQSSCHRHIFCQCAEENGGILHTLNGAEEARRVGLIAVERHFPIPITVTDAQYVWRGPPTLLPQNPDVAAAYFENGLNDHCGRSAVATPFNRSYVSPEKEDPLTEELFPATGEESSSTEYSPHLTGEESSLPSLPMSRPEETEDNAPPRRTRRAGRNISGRTRIR